MIGIIILPKFRITSPCNGWHFDFGPQCVRAEWDTSWFSLLSSENWNSQPAAISI